MIPVAGGSGASTSCVAVARCSEIAGRTLEVPPSGIEIRRANQKWIATTGAGAQVRKRMSVLALDHCTPPATLIALVAKEDFAIDANEFREIVVKDAIDNRDRVGALAGAVEAMRFTFLVLIKTHPDRAGLRDVWRASKIEYVDLMMDNAIHENYPTLRAAFLQHLAAIEAEIEKL